jgi:hypothetical protein
VEGDSVILERCRLLELLPALLTRQLQCPPGLTEQTGINQSRIPGYFVEGKSVLWILCDSYPNYPVLGHL